MIVLTPQERQRFIDWLAQELESDNQIYAQMEKMQLPPVVTTNQRQKIAAKIVVHRELSSIEVQTIEQTTPRADKPE